MGHHINDQGQFQSDKHPELPPDRIRLNFHNPHSQEALWKLACSYAGLVSETSGLPRDQELAEDIGVRLFSIGFRPRNCSFILPMTDREMVRALLHMGSTPRAPQPAQDLGALGVTKLLLGALESVESRANLQEILDGVRDLCAAILFTEDVDPESFTNEVRLRVTELRSGVHLRVAQQYLDPADG